MKIKNTFPKFLSAAIISLLLSVPSISNAQEEDKQIYTIVEEMPSYRGCENLDDEAAKRDCTVDKIMGFFSENLSYPEEAKAKGIEGKVYLSYIVDKDGKITDVKVLRGVQNGTLLDEEAVKVVEKLPDFNPGKQRGKAVAVRYNIPINFSLNNEGEEETVK